MRIRRLWSGLLILLLGLAGCTADSATRLWLNAPGWSRAVQVGNAAINDPVPFLNGPDGVIYLLNVAAVDDTTQPEVLALDRSLNPLWTQRLDVALTLPDQPLLRWRDGQLHLFWLSDRALYTAVLDATGAVLQTPTQLSGAAIVNDYDVAMGPDGRFSIWYAGPRRAPGLYVLEEGVADPVLVDPQAIRPHVFVAADGVLYAAWAHHPQGETLATLFYGVYADGVYAPGQAQAIATVRLSITSILSGPWFGIERQNAYLFWNLEVRTGQEAGTVSTQYITFPLGQPRAASEPRILAAPSEPDEFVYRATSRPRAFLAGPRLVLTEQAYSLDGRVRELAPAPTTGSELAVAAGSPSRHQFRKRPTQVGVFFFHDGSPSDYQLLSYTTASSSSPALASDDAGHLYITWLERSSESGFNIYLASTAPDVVAALSNITGADLNRLASEVLFGLAAGIALAPLVTTVWALGGLMALGITSFLRSENLGRWGTLLSLGLALVLYNVFKLLTLPGMRTYVPFSAWIPFIPPWMQAPLQIGVPILTTIIGMLVAWHFIYRRGQKSALYFLFLFAGVDGFLTAAVYGVLIYNSF